jgi:diguanylate cyclase (GGDEF)-like protein
MASLPADTPRRASPSLVRRLTRLSVVVLGATLLLTALGLSYWVYHSLLDAQLRSAKQSAQLLAENLAPTLAFRDRQATEEALAAFSRREGLVALKVWMATGEPFVQWPREAEPELFIHAMPQQNWRGMRFVEPVLLQGEHIGVLSWSESFEKLNETLLRVGAGAAVLLGLALAVASLLLSWTQRRALAPLLSLSRLAERVATSQDYSLRAEVHDHDEVGRLTERFNGMLRRIEIWHEDMNQQLAQEQQTGRALQQLAHRDPLTGLPNRLAFELSLERQLLEVHQSGQRMALLFIDLDNFKAVNDSLGHAAGDEVLVEVVRRMGAVVRADDTLFRLGGDEFALIVSAVSETEAVDQLAERVIACVREPLVVQGSLQPVGATVGLAFAPDDAKDPQSLLCAADAAMYAAKHAGKNTFRRARAAQTAGPPGV